jgi:SAM-dependent methyltransferase
VTALQQQLVLTGERTLPGIWHENYWFRRHEAAYLALVPFVTGARVVDLGSGEGYGTALLARHARDVLAVELEAPVAEHVRRTHALPVLRADLQRLPLATGGAEVLVNLQTIEHLWDQPGFLTECARVLRPGGTLRLTTPNSVTFPRGNPFHTTELDLPALQALLAPGFTVTRHWGLRHGRRLARWERRHGSLIARLVAEPWQHWPQDLCDLVRSVTAADFTVGQADPMDLDLVVVAVKR